jgi:hypothetical protein
VECAYSAPSVRAGRDPCANDANGQTHQCGVSDRCFNPAYQHHEPGAGRGNDARAARTGINAGRERAIAVTAPGFGGAHAGGGQEAGGGEIIVEAGAGSACAGSTCSRRGE